MYLNIVAGSLATVALLVPLLLLVTGRLYKNGSLLALSLYYMMAVFYNLMQLNAIKWPVLTERRLAVFFNYLDAPLMLVSLLFFCNDAWRRRLVLLSLVLFLLFESCIAFLLGFDEKSSLYLLGPGTVLVLSFAIFFFTYYGKRSIVQGKSLGKTFMLVSVLFLYGCYLMIYYLHYLKHMPAVNDIFLMYYIGQLISAVFMSLGLAWIVKRTRKMKELQLTRKELALFFDN